MTDTPQPIAAPSTQDAVALVRDDHAAIRAAFDARLAALQGEASEADRQGLLSRVALRLRAHGEIEREFLYPALRSAAGDPLAAAAEAEHAEFERALQALSAQPPVAAGRNDALRALAARVFRHFDAEEAGMLADATHRDVDLLALGTRMALRRGELLADLGTD